MTLLAAPKRLCCPSIVLVLLTVAISGVEGEGVKVWPQQDSNPPPLPSPIALPKFTDVVSNTTVVVGRSATLKCSVDSLTKYKIAWVKSDTQTLLSIENTMITRNYRLRVSHSDHTTWFLHIDDASMSDRGNYMCQINTVPPLVGHRFLEVVVPPDIVDEKLSADVEVNEDSPAQLKCMATGYPAPDIKFKRFVGNMVKRRSRGKSSTKILTNSMEIVRALREDASEETKKNLKKGSNKKSLGVALTIGYLTFDRVTRLDMGHYLCIANNSVPPSVSKRVILNVRYREPEVVVGQQMLGVYRGDDVAINCTVTAYPRPVVFWQDGSGRMIISGGHYQVFERQIKESPPVLQTTLVIRNVQAEDISSYTCNASIDNDRTRSTSLLVQLNEMSRPSTEVIKFDVTYNVARQGQNLRKSRPQNINPLNELQDGYEKTASYNKPEIFSKSNLGQSGTFDVPKTSVGTCINVKSVMVEGFICYFILWIIT